MGGWDRVPLAGGTLWCLTHQFMRIASGAGRIGPFTWINSALMFTQVPRVRVQMWGGFAWRRLPHVEAEIL